MWSSFIKIWFRSQPEIRNQWQWIVRQCIYFSNSLCRHISSDFGIRINIANNWFRAVMIMACLAALPEFVLMAHFTARNANSVIYDISYIYLHRHSCLFTIFISGGYKTFRMVCGFYSFFIIIICISWRIISPNHFSLRCPFTILLDLWFWFPGAERFFRLPWPLDILHCESFYANTIEMVF